METNTKAPDFSLPDQDGKQTSLKDFKGKWIILYTYPKDNTPGCTIEAIDFSQEKNEFEKRNAVILGLSPDSEKSHCKFIEKQSLTITLLSDPEHKILEQYESWGKKKFMGREYMGVIRSTFLIDPNGIIREIWKDVKVKNHAEQVKERLEELQSTTT